MDLVMMRGRDAVCDSLEVAEHFGKRHDNVIMTIDNLLKIKEIKSRKIFISQTYKDSKGRTYRNYLMNRDGFSLLVMGFNGKEAENEIHRSVQPHGAASRPEADGGLQRHKGIPESHQEAGNRCNQGSGGLRRGAGEPERSKVLFQPVKACR